MSTIATATRTSVASRLFRDFVRDWKRWSVVERVVASTLIAILPAAAPVAFIGMALGVAG